MLIALRIVGPFTLVAALASCSSGEEEALAINVIGSQRELVESGYRLTDGGRLVRAATAEGLVAFDAGGRVVPALAERWIVTDGGLSYIFRLREGSDAAGTPITGEKAREALRQVLAGLQGTALGMDLDGIAEVRAMTGRVLEVRLSHPKPDLLDLLAQPELALLDKGRGTGPFQLRREKGAVALRPVPPEKRGLPEDPKWQDEMRTARLVARDATGAARAFAEGKTDLVLGGTAADYGAALSAAGISRRFLRSDPVSGLFGLVVASDQGVLASAELREALSMAIDRDALAADLGIPGWTPTTRLVPASVADAPVGIGERWSGIEMASRRTTAAQRLARFSKGGKAVVLRIGLPGGPGADRLFARVEADFAAVGLTARRVALDAPAELRLLDATARYGRADWYLNQFACNAGRALCSRAADIHATEARGEADPARRAERVTEAEAQLTLANTYIPLGNPLRWALVRDPQPGFVTNTRGYHPLLPLVRRPR